MSPVRKTVTFFISVLFLSFSALSFAQDTELTLSSDSGEIGDEANLTLSIVNNHDVSNIDVDFAFDENQLELRPGGDSCGFIDIDPDIGQFNVNCSDLGGGVLRVLVDPQGVFPIPILDSGGLFSIRFTIAATATVNATTDVVYDALTVRSDDGTNVTANVDAQPGSVDVLDGPPQPQPTLVVEPTVIDFGTVDGNDMPQSETVTVTNDGDEDSTLDISNVAYTGDTAFTPGSGCDGASLGQGESCTIQVVFDTADDGAYSGSISIESNAGNQTVSVDGSRASVASLSVNPPSGNVNLGSGFQGDTLSATAVISNDGSADGSFECSLTDPSGVFNATPLSGTVPAGGESSVSLSCTLPAEAEDGDSFGATFSCAGSEGFSSDHELSCTVSEFEPLPVPTMQTWSLIMFALMMLLAGGLSIRFFRT